MESSGQMGAYISSRISTNGLIFGQGAFFTLIFLNIIGDELLLNFGAKFQR